MPVRGLSQIGTRFSRRRLWPRQTNDLYLLLVLAHTRSVCYCQRQAHNPGALRAQLAKMTELQALLSPEQREALRRVKEELERRNQAERAEQGEPQLPAERWPQDFAPEAQ